MATQKSLDQYTPTTDIARLTNGMFSVESGRFRQLKNRWTSTPQPYRLPEIQRRETTWHMENWYRPLRAWYNDERPQLDLSELRDREFDAVIEIGLMNYEIADNRLMMQVMVKWFDDAAGEPLGRARHHAIPTVGSPDEMFGNQGEEFKRLFRETGRELVRSCLTEVVGAR